jgi:hypothetical protein
MQCMVVPSQEQSLPFAGKDADHCLALPGCRAEIGRGGGHSRCGGQQGLRLRREAVTVRMPLDQGYPERLFQGMQSTTDCGETDTRLPCRLGICALAGDGQQKLDIIPINHVRLRPSTGPEHLTTIVAGGIAKLQMMLAAQIGAEHRRNVV